VVDIQFQMKEKGIDSPQMQVRYITHRRYREREIEPDEIGFRCRAGMLKDTGTIVPSRAVVVFGVQPLSVGALANANDCQGLCGRPERDDPGQGPIKGIVHLPDFAAIFRKNSASAGSSALSTIACSWALPVSESCCGGEPS